MKSTTLKKYQLILQHFRLLLSEIDYSRFLATKNDCILVIEDRQQIADWADQLKFIVKAIHSTSKDLNTQISTSNNIETALQTTEAAIDDLIYLHKEIISSCAYEADLMEGRYLIQNLVGSYLDQMGHMINEYRYRLNSVVFNCDQTATVGKTIISLKIELSSEVEAIAVADWLTSHKIVSG